MVKQIEFGDRNGGSWGTVKVGRKGWAVETFSRYQGTRSGSVVFVPFDAKGIGIDPTDDLTADYNECMSNADHVIHFARECEDLCIVRRRGDVVQ